MAFHKNPQFLCVFSARELAAVRPQLWMVVVLGSAPHRELQLPGEGSAAFVLQAVPVPQVLTRVGERSNSTPHRMFRL